MADRKETPDVLGELLGGQAVARPAESAPATRLDPSPKAPARSARRPWGAGQAQRAKLTRWQYVEIVFRDYGGFRPRYVNGEEVKQWKWAPLIHEYLNHLGEQGWELVSVGRQHRGQMPVYLKRSKA